MYRWTPEIKVEVDALEFDRCPRGKAVYRFCEIGFNDRFRPEIIWCKDGAKQTYEYCDHNHNAHADPKVKFVS